MRIMLESKFWKAPIERQALEAAKTALNETWRAPLWRVEGNALAAGPVTLGVAICDNEDHNNVAHQGPLDVYVKVVRVKDHIFDIPGVAGDDAVLLVSLRDYRRLACPLLLEAEKDAIRRPLEERIGELEAALRDEQVARQARVLELEATVEGLREKLRAARQQVAKG